MKTKSAIFFLLPLIVLCCGKKDETVATVTSKAGLIIQSEATVNSRKVDTIPSGSEVIVFDINGPEDTLFGIKSRWYKIQFNNVTGWGFGGFLEIHAENKNVHRISIIEHEKKDSLSEHDNIYHFNHTGKRYTVDPAGNLTSDTNKNVSLKLVNEYEDIRVLYYENYSDDILLIYEATDGDSSWSKIVRIDPVSLTKKILDVQFPGLNLSQGLVDKNYIYLAAVDFIGKFNIETGRFQWQDDDFYSKAHIDVVSDIILKDKKIHFIEWDKKLSQEPRKKVIVNMYTGVIEEITAL